MLISLAQAQTKSGTVIILGFSQQKVVVAADSRESTMSGDYRDDACKITALEQKLIFVATGKGKAGEWSSATEARAAVRALVTFSQDFKPELVDAIAGKWGDAAGQQIISRLGPEKVKDNQVLISGIFVGANAMGVIHISQQTLRAKVSRGHVSFSKLPIVHGEPTSVMHFTAIGEADIYNEYQAGISARANKWKAGSSAYLKSSGIADVEAAFAIMLVDLTGKYGKDRVPHHPDVALVGGPTDAIALTSKGAEWIHRKKDCPER